MHIFPFLKKTLANGKSTAVQDDVFEKSIGSGFPSVHDFAAATSQAIWMFVCVFYL